MMSSFSVNNSNKTVDLTFLNSYTSYIVNLKYNPSGYKIFITRLCSFDLHFSVVSGVDTSKENMQ